MISEKWSNGEKKIARKAFLAALDREFAAVKAKLKEMIEHTPASPDIWDIEDYLRNKRKEMAGKYDYRYSILIFVFARLLREGWLKEEELRGIHEDKIEQIRTVLNL